MKAILITKSNVDQIASRYGIETWEFEERLPIGYYVVTDFGNDDKFDVLTKQNFDTYFLKTGNIDNGWISIDFL